MLSSLTKRKKSQHPFISRDVDVYQSNINMTKKIIKLRLPTFEKRQM